MAQQRESSSIDQKIDYLDQDPFIIRCSRRSITCKCRNRSFTLPGDYRLQDWEKHVQVFPLRCLKQKGLQVRNHHEGFLIVLLKCDTTVTR